MAKTYEQKIVYGFSKIHVAKVTGEGYISPVEVLGGKSVEATFDMSEKKIYADDKTVCNDVRVSGGKGKLSVLGLTTEEKALLFGSTNMSGGYALGSNVSMPNLALLFEQQKKDGGKLLHVIYNVQFSPAGINAVSTEEEIEESVIDLEFSCIPGSNGYYAYTVDTTDTSADTTMIGKWFTEVQDPKPTAQA